VFEKIKIKEHKNPKKEQFNIPSILNVEIFTVESEWKAHLATAIHNGAPTVEIDRSHPNHELLKQKVIELNPGIPLCVLPSNQLFIFAHNKGAIYGVVTSSDFTAKIKSLTSTSAQMAAYQKQQQNPSFSKNPQSIPSHFGLLPGSQISPFPNTMSISVQQSPMIIPQPSQAYQPIHPLSGQSTQVSVPTQGNVHVQSIKNQPMSSQQIPLPMGVVGNPQNKPQGSVPNPIQNTISATINTQNAQAQNILQARAAQRAAVNSLQYGVSPSILQAPLLSTRFPQNPQQIVEQQPMGGLPQHPFTTTNSGH